MKPTILKHCAGRNYNSPLMQGTTGSQAEADFWLKRDAAKSNNPKDPNSDPNYRPSKEALDAAEYKANEAYKKAKAARDKK
jgi:hypothetical protein